MAVMMYADNWEGHVPDKNLIEINYPDYGVNGDYGFAMLCEVAKFYDKKNSYSNYSPYTGPGNAWGPAPYKQSFWILKCPSSTTRRWMSDGYGWNFNITAGFLTMRAADLWGIRDPAGIFLWVDATSFTASSSQKDRISNAAYRHNGGCNICWADGHVSWEKISSVDDIPDSWFRR